jgi:formylglycine-generating enzyme required for sulfatase activity
MAARIQVLTIDISKCLVRDGLLILITAALIAAGESALAAEGPSPELLKAPFGESAAKSKQQEWARYLKRDFVEKNSLAEKMVLVPPGEFMMGKDASPLHDRFPYMFRSDIEDELPQHRARITKPFYLGATTVTYGNFRFFCDDAHYKTDAERDGKPNWGYDPKGAMIQSKDFTFRNPGWAQTDEHPVVYVTWNDAVAFCGWLSKKEGKKYRLPTEAEWEYACRAGTEHLYFWGDDPEKMVTYGNGPDQDLESWYDENKRRKVLARIDGIVLKDFVPFPFLLYHDGYRFAAPVGKFQPNAFGLYDMIGNVGQWCSDWHAADYYKNSPTDDPLGPASGSERVIRGGSWHSPPAYSRCASRGRNEAGYRFDMFGFRVVCER